MLVGAAAGLVFTGLEPSLTGVIAVGDRPAQGAGTAVTLTVGQLILAGLAGVAGARILTDAVDKRILAQRVIEAAAGPASLGHVAAAAAAIVSPAESWRNSSTNANPGLGDF
jgi:hypothetical protein